LLIQKWQYNIVEVGVKRAYNITKLEMIIKFTNYYIISLFYR